MSLWKRRTAREEKDEAQKKEEVERSIAYIKSQVRVIDARVKVLEQQHEGEAETGTA